MKYKNKTKKGLYKKMKKRKYNSTIKYMRGGNLDNNTETPKEVLDEVKREHEFSLSAAPVLQKTSELAEGVALKTIENIGMLLGVDLSNPRDINGNLDKIKVALSNPETKEKIRSIIGQISEILGVAIEAASPFIEPLMNKTFEVGTAALSKMSESAVKIGLNTAEEIPGVGVLIGTVRSLSSAMEAFLAGVNAGDEVVTSSSDTINAAVRNFKQIMKDKQNSLDRINNSVNNFQAPYNQSQMQNKMQSQMQNQVYRGGKMRSKKIN